MNGWIETEHLILRPWENTEEDAAALYRFASDSTIGPAAGWPAHTSLDESRKVLRNILCTPEIYAVLPKSTGKPSGCAGITYGRTGRPSLKEQEGEIGYCIGAPFQGKGFATEAVRALLKRAFEDLKLRTIWCGYYEGNAASARVQEKCGLAWHHKEEHTYLPLLDEYRTEHFTRITRKEWRKSSLLCQDNS